MRHPALCWAAVLAIAHLVRGQTPTPTPSNSTGSPTNSTTSPSISLSLTTSSVSVVISTTIANTPTVVTTILPAVVNVTYTLTPTATPTTNISSTTNDTASAETTTPTPEPIVLETRVDPAFGVLGAILILTGLPSAFWGHKNRWTSFFLIGFYTLSLVCVVLILKFGVIPAINPPSKTLRGMFVLASTIAGFAGGAIAIFFWKAARYGIGAWGGFAFALWLQCFSHGGLIKPIGFRWILYICCGVAGFALCTIPKIHYHVLLISTAFVGATSFILGVDCYTTAGLKEFYIWNLGFPSLFPKFVSNGIQFPVSQQMQIELGLIGAVALMGIAVQFRILKVLQKKLQEIAQEERKRDEEAEAQAAARLDDINREKEDWEREHPTLPKHGRQESSFSTTPLMKDRDGSSTPTTGDRLSTYHPQEEGRTRVQSGVSDFKAAPTSEEELRRATRYMQNPGVLPTLDLGLGIQEDVPASFIANTTDVPKSEDQKRKEELLVEIQNIRKSIDILKSETPIPSSTDPSRRPSLSSRRTLSVDANHALVPSSSFHARPPRAADPRARSHSMEFSALTRLSSDPISRPTSVPLNDMDWETYIQDRKLLQPPSGVTAPIPTTPIPSSPTTRAPLPPAVQEALSKRKRRESALFTDSAGSSIEDVPLARIAKEHRSTSGGAHHHQSSSNQYLHPSSHHHQHSSSSNSPVTILPPRRPSQPIAAPVPQPAARTKTFEELNERHREKIRGLQEPLTRATKEQLELEAAKQRWERSNAIEKEVMTRKQAEKLAALEKKKRPSDAEGRGEKTKSRSPTGVDPRRRHSRSMSADRLGMGSGHESASRRFSTMKVEDWQRYQQEVDGSGSGGKPGAAGKSSPTRRERSGSGSGMLNPQGVPFPADQRRKSRDHLS